jgi:uncharacterized protein (DUF2141 family)
MSGGLLLSLGLAVFAGGSASAASLDIQVSGVASAKGKIMVAVCERGTFLNGKRCAYGAVAPAAQGQVRLHVDGVPPGMWAVEAFHDENGNGKLDTNFIGMPREGVAFSRDAQGKYGPPTFNDAAVQVGDQPQTLAVTMRY